MFGMLWWIFFEKDGHQVVEDGTDGILTHPVPGEGSWTPVRGVPAWKIHHGLKDKMALFFFFSDAADHLGV